MSLYYCENSITVQWGGGGGGGGGGEGGGWRGRGACRYTSHLYSFGSRILLEGYEKTSATICHSL